MSEAAPITIMIGAVGSVGIYAAQTPRPWELPIDAIVLPVDSGGWGRLGQAYLAAFPDLPVPQPALSVITPEQPFLVSVNPVATGRFGTPMSLILATARKDGTGLSTLEGVAIATNASLVQAQRAGAARVGIPLLGTGLGNLPTPTVAAAMIGAIRAASLAGIGRIVMFDQRAGTSETLITAWAMATNGSGSGHVAATGADAALDEPQSGAVRVQLGRIRGVEVFAARTDTPWELPIDALVLPADRTGPGALALSFDQTFPSFQLPPAVIAAVTPERPSLVPTGAFLGRSSSVTGLIFVTARPNGTDDADVRSAAVGTQAAIELAQSQKIARLALPLLGTGSNGLDLVEVARAVAGTAFNVPLGALREVTFVGESADFLPSIQRAWNDAFASAMANETETPEPNKADSDPITMTSTAQEVFDAAISVTGGDPARITPELIWYCALRRALDNKGNNVATILLDELTRDVGTGGPANVLTTLGELHDSQKSYPTGTPGGGIRLLTAARSIARRLASAGDVVRQRDLLAAVVLDPEAAAAIERAYPMWTPEISRQRLRSAIAATPPNEFPQVWDQILLRPEVGSEVNGALRRDPESEASASVLTGGVSADLVDPELGIPLSQDYLGIRTFVEMLATVIADRDTPLPLSIGLFGEWGSGKSYFMGLLRKQIDELPKTDSETYLGGIEHIVFNAWHYADTNLWASLGNTIFEKLAGGCDSNDKRRQKLRQELVEKIDRRQDLDQATERAQAEAATLRASLQTARWERASAGTNLLKAMTASSEAKGLLSAAWRRLGVADEAEREQLLVGEARGLRSDGLILRRATSGLRGAAVVALLVVSLALIGVALLTPSSVGHLLAGSGVAGIAAGLGAAAALIARVRSGAQKLTEVVRQTRDEALAGADLQLQASYDELNQAVTREQVLTAQRDEAIARVGEIGRELADLDPGRQWYGFVADRAASNDYRGQLGLVSTIRQDFKRLIALMADWRTNPSEHGDYDPINRIVLYIDDLDRCSPRQVMDVLQAVHLLLALDLFVVVVGVDPRWLLQSLRQQYRENFSHEQAKDVPVGKGHRVAEPLDYLEKIFNIPFVLPRMTTTSFDDLIRKISADTQRASDERRARSAAGKSGAASTVASPADVADTARPPQASDVGSESAVRAGAAATDLVATEIPVEAGSPVALARAGVSAPTRRGLTEPEFAMLGCLGNGIGSPREAKRLLNLYRILRSTRSTDSPASAFLKRDGGGGEYQAVIVLLGILSAQPTLFGELMSAVPGPGDGAWAGGLPHRDPTSSWADLAADLVPVAGVDGAHNGLGPLSKKRGHEWTLLIAQLAPVSAQVTLPDLQPFQAWGPQIARFSFVLSPLAASVS